MSKHELRAKRATTLDAFKALGVKLNSFAPVKLPATATEAEKTAATTAKAGYEADKVQFEALKTALAEVDEQITRILAVEEAERASALEVPNQEKSQGTIPAVVKSDFYTNTAVAEARGLMTHRGMTIGGVCRMLGAGRGSVREAIDISEKQYGAGHPVTRALIAGVGGSGGFIVPPEYINEIIELLRPTAVVRSANPRTMPMPRGTMTLPAQTSAATASYAGETSKITVSQQTLGQIIASYKKLTALVPISNDLMRYADPAADAFVRDDLVKVIALREDLAFIMGDGTSYTPRGFLSFANQYCVSQNGTAGVWLSTGNSTAAVNGSNPASGQSGGNFVTSTETYTLQTVASELGGMVNKLDTCNVPDNRRVWFMHPRSYNYLFNVQNSLGLYVYRDELMTGKLLTYPIKRTTQIPINIYDANGANTDCSFVFLVEMTDALLLDAMTLELFVSREGGYTDTAGTQVNIVQQDQTLVRAIAEHDFQMRHDAAVAVDQYVRWAPAIS